MNNIVELMQKLSNEGVQIRISNKSAEKYWWVYLIPTHLDEMIVKQGNDPMETFLAAVEELESELPLP
jgi:hypothetical protein